MEYVRRAGAIDEGYGEDNEAQPKDDSGASSAPVLNNFLMSSFKRCGHGGRVG